MDALRFDTLIRSLLTAPSRRSVLRATVGASLALDAQRSLDTARARSRKKKLARNAFGCVDVGKPCRGKDSACCSAHCQGKKPKNGAKDKSRCVAHDERGCRDFDDSCGPGDTFCTSSSGNEFAKCFHTTGNAGYCAQGVACVPCARDTDCNDACGEGAACVICPDACPGSETMCVGVNACS